MSENTHIAEDKIEKWVRMKLVASIRPEGIKQSQLCPAPEGAHCEIIAEILASPDGRRRLLQEFIASPEGFENPSSD